MEFKTQFNRDKFPEQNEKGGGVSMTIPDQILQRYAAGLSTGAVRSPLYYGDEVHDDIGDHNLEGLDELDRIDYLREKEQELLAIQKRLQDNANAKKRNREIQEALRKQFEKETAEKDAQANAKQKTNTP